MEDNLSRGTNLLSICRANSNICQIRLDFDTFVIHGPSTNTDDTGFGYDDFPVVKNLNFLSLYASISHLSRLSSGAVTVPAATDTEATRDTIRWLEN